MRLLTPDEVASLCGYSRKAIYRAIERGELPATKRCSRWRILAEDVERWLEDGVRVVDNDSRISRERTLPPVALRRGSFGALLAREEELA
jgi:excisionase family DNA binding protein